MNYQFSLHNAIWRNDNFNSSDKVHFMCRPCKRDLGCRSCMCWRRTWHRTQRGYNKHSWLDPVLMFYAPYVTYSNLFPSISTSIVWHVGFSSFHLILFSLCAIDVSKAMCIYWEWNWMWVGRGKDVYSCIFWWMKFIFCSVLLRMWCYVRTRMNSCMIMEIPKKAPDLVWG